MASPIVLNSALEQALLCLNNAQGYLGQTNGHKSEDLDNSCRAIHLAVTNLKNELKRIGDLNNELPSYE